MKLKNSLLTSVLFACLLGLLVACGGGSAITASDIPAYPDAVLLQPGDDQLADTLLQNAEQDAALRSSLGVSGSLEQVAYKLPAETSWDQIKSFYGDELEGDGWESGIGGPGGNLANDLMESVNSSNELLQTGSWSKGDQIITLIRNVNPTAMNEIYLIISLNTN